jgi:hypothetical protein
MQWACMYMYQLKYKLNWERIVKLSLYLFKFYNKCLWDILGNNLRNLLFVCCLNFKLRWKDKDSNSISPPSPKHCTLDHLIRNLNEIRQIFLHLNLGENTYQHEGFCGFPQSLWIILRRLLKLDLVRFLPYPPQSIPLYHRTNLR